MKCVRAIVFDVYHTLLEVGRPQPDASLEWSRLIEEHTGSPGLTQEDFLRAIDGLIARDHAQARALGIAWPEVQWAGIVTEVIPALKSLPAAACDDFVFRERQIHRSLRLAEGAAESLRWLHQKGVILGIASNAQAYTLREIQEALRAEELDLSLFDPGLCFWSYQHGFSKPDPHVFRILTARLAARSISPHEILMIGDRLDNDVQPAIAQDWQGWHFTNHPVSEHPGGSFCDLVAALAEAVP